MSRTCSPLTRTGAAARGAPGSVAADLDYWTPRALLARFASLFEGSRPESRMGVRELTIMVVLVAAGAAMRFWGLGVVGLHGDEKTMALPVMHLVQYGSPRFPSGMFYARGIGQVYMMAGAVELFGQSAWAFRLPSALCGVLLIALTPLVGRRFLTAPWNLALTAAVAFLPRFIEDAQTARMYVFLITCVAAFIVLLIEWERTGRSAWLAAATAMLIVGIQFHQLAIFAAFLVLYPGLLRADRRKLALGIVSFGVIAISFLVISHWVDSFYPHITALPGTPDIPSGPRAADVIPHPGVPILAAGAVIAALLGAFVRRALPSSPAGLAAGGLVGLALLAQLLNAWQVAALLFVAAVVLLSRAAPAGRRMTVLLRICAAALAAVLLFTAQVVIFVRSGVPAHQAIGALLGWPSVRPFLGISHYSPVAALVLAAGAAAACVRLARGRAAPDFLLFVALGVWIPLLMIGMFKWDIPSRYAATQVIPLLIGAFAAAQWLARSAARRFAGSSRRAAPRWQVSLAALTAVLAVNPVSLARAAGSGYSEHPDHAGAARFIRSQHPGPKDIVIAEDVIVQTYYLGHVDYWLAGKRTASQYAYWHDGRFEDFYTDTPIITTADQLKRLIARPDRGAIYIIGSGEQQADGRAYARGPSLERFLTSPTLPVVYVGRDGLTKVWKIPAPARIPAGTG